MLICRQSIIITDWSLKDLKALILEVIASFPSSLCIFLDGLDKLDPQESFLDPWDLVCEIKIAGLVKIYLAFRPELQIKKELSIFPCLRLQDLNFSGPERLRRGKTRAEAIRAHGSQKEIKNERKKPLCLDWPPRPKAYFCGFVSSRSVSETTRIKNLALKTLSDGSILYLMRLRSFMKKCRRNQKRASEEKDVLWPPYTCTELLNLALHSALVLLTFGLIP